MNLPVPEKSSSTESKQPPSSGPQDAAARTTVNAATAPDPFNPASLRLSQDFNAAVGVKKLLTTVPVRKPSKESFVQVHPDPAYRVETMVLELKEDREIYLVAPALWPTLNSEPTVSARLLLTAVNTLGVVFLWPIRLPGPDGRIDEWSRSAMDAANKAMEGNWVRVFANMSLGAYEISVATTDRKAIWPQETFGDLLRIAFKDKYIDKADHPVLKHLRGEL